MRKHTKVYMDYFGYKIPEDSFCEVCQRPTTDIHHINGRGKGKDVIENLIGLCRNCHIVAHSHGLTKAELTEIHLTFMKV